MDLVLPLPLALVGVAATALLAGASVSAGALTSRAGLVATLFGILIVVLLGFAYLALLVLFVVASVLATRYRLDEKTRRNVQEGSAGERGVSNVLAHILVPTGLAVVTLLPRGAPDPVLLSAAYASALAFGASDTFASEFGVLHPHAVSIVSGRSVAAGTNGGVSTFGTAFAAVGAITTAVVGLGLFALFGVGTGSAPVWVAVVAIAGFLGCQIDSLLGALLENRGYLSKGGTNLCAMVAATALGALMILAATGGL